MNRILVNVLLVLVLIGLAAATGYVYMQSEEELRNNEMLAERFIQDAQNSPAPVIVHESPDPKLSTDPAKKAPVSTTTPVIKNWKTYTEQGSGVIFQHPEEVTVSDFEREWIDVPKYRGAAFNVGGFADLEYLTLHEELIFVGIDLNRPTYAACIAGETEKKTRPDGVVLHRLPITKECNSYGCTVGYHYKIFRNNLCYAATVFAIQGNMDRFYEANDPLFALGNEQNQIAKTRLYSIFEKLVSTITWTK